MIDTGEEGASVHRSDGSPRHRSGRRGTGAAARARHASPRGEGFGRFAAVTALAIVPGAGLLATGRRVAGGLLLGLTVLALIVAGAFAFSGGAVDQVLSASLRPRTLVTGAVVVAVIAALWCLSIIATALVARQRQPSVPQRLLAVGLVTAVCAVVAAPSGVGVRYALIQRDLVKSMFSGTDLAGNDATPSGAVPATTKRDPWADVPRVNMLLLGSDAGSDRTGVRTDSMIVASIDTRTGDTVLFGLPRSLQKVPFPAKDPLHTVWPNGFNCGDVCLLNAVWEQAATVHRDLFKGVKNPGLTATRDVISEVLGLPIDFYTTIDLRGFQSLVDAMGGVVVDVPRDIPIGGGHSLSGRALPVYGHIAPGRKRLNGFQALWFARSRQGSDDYDRMGRQRCMVTALLDQANPVALLGKYPQLAKVAKKNIRTDVRQRDLTAWVTLVQRVQKGHIRSLPLTNKVISTVNPDFAQIRTLVQKAIAPKPAASTAKPKSSKPATKDLTQAQDAASVC